MCMHFREQWQQRNGALMCSASVSGCRQPLVRHFIIDAVQCFEQVYC
jgi:hypothetical protein